MGRCPRGGVENARAAVVGEVSTLNRGNLVSFSPLRPIRVTDSYVAVATAAVNAR